MWRRAMDDGSRIRRNVLVAAILLLAVAAGVAPSSVAGDEGAREKGRKAPDAEVKPVTVKLADADLLDQDGNRVRFRSDVVKDRLVVIDVFYTTCPLVCPILSATFSDLQDLLGDRLGREVFLVSVTVDPVTDIPPRLKEYARRWDAKPGWIFLTGARPDVDRVLRGLEAYAADFTDHPAMMLVGDAASGEWARFYGFPSPEMLSAKLDALRAKRKARREEGAAALPGEGTR
jgi:protein SCO1/2